MLNYMRFCAYNKTSSATFLMTLPLSIMKALQHAMQRLTPASDSARLDAEALLSFVMRCTRSHLHTWPERLLDDTQVQLYSTLIERCAAGRFVTVTVSNSLCADALPSAVSCLNT